MRTWLWLSAGGIIGTVGRYVLSGLVYRWFGPSFPFGTLAVNLTGCVGVGFLGALADQKLVLGSEARTFLMMGLLGAFTTFSTLIYESWRLLQAGQLLLAATNLLASVVLGLAACWLGWAAGTLL